VVRIGEELFVKQLRFCKEDGELVCASLNSAYRDISVKPSELHIIGEAVAAMQRER